MTSSRMHASSMTSSSVWQRRTNKIIAAAVFIIGLTMMISTIPQCIYAGLIFIVTSLAWLGWMAMKDKKRVPRTLGQSASPVLFLVTSQSYSASNRYPTPADPNDKPPSYDTILNLDGLPPDYYSVMVEKPPRYEDARGCRESSSSSACLVQASGDGESRLSQLPLEVGSFAHGGAASSSLELPQDHSVQKDLSCDSRHRPAPPEDEVICSADPAGKEAGSYSPNGGGRRKGDAISR